MQLPHSLVGQDTRLSPVRPGFKSRTGKFFSLATTQIAKLFVGVGWCRVKLGLCAFRAPLAELAAVNLQVFGFIPIGGAYF